jgi:hypothetical protein
MLEHVPLSGTARELPTADDGLDLTTLWDLSPRFDLVMAIGEHLYRALDRHPGPTAVACYDSWSTRIAIEVIAAGPRSADTWLLVGEPTAELFARAERRHVMLTEATAESTRHAAVVVAPRLDGIDSVGTEVSALSAGHADHCTLVWSMSRCWPDRVAATRALFKGHGFHELGTESVGVVDPWLPGWFVASETRGPVPAVASPGVATTP